MMWLSNWLRTLKSSLGRTETRRTSRRRKPPARPGLEVLEDRTLPSTFTVLNTNDSGGGSLRQAILDANAAANVDGPDRIEFNIDTGDAGYQSDTASFRIRPETQLPGVSDPVVIDGYTQPGARENTLAGVGQLGVARSEAQGDNAVLKIELDGSRLTDRSSAGLVVGSNSTVQGLVINRFGYGGILVDHGDNSVIRGNFFGTDVTGTTAFGAEGQDRLGNVIDVAVRNASHILIGGTDPGSRNLISGAFSDGSLGNDRAFGNGIEVIQNTDDVVIQGNFVGTDRSGRNAFDDRGLPLGNAGGIDIFSSGTFTVGGVTPGAGNLISGNTYGVSISYATVAVEGNSIGTDVTGTSAYSAAGRLGNYHWGVGVYRGTVVVGGTADGAGNLLSGNGVGINVGGPDGTTQVQGNFIGTEVTGTTATDPGPDGIVGTADDRSLGNDTGLLLSASNSTIGGTTAAARNIISGNSTGISVVALGDSPIASGNVIEGNYIGTDRYGTRAIGNGYGVRLGNGAVNNTVGGTTKDARNIISGNDPNGPFGGGVIIGGSGTTNLPSGNVVQGNYIGTDPEGKTATGTDGRSLGNWTGVTIGAASHTAVRKNVISGGFYGVKIANDGPAELMTENVVQDNYIGTDAGGQSPLGNAWVGVILWPATGAQILDNVIAGGTGGHPGAYDSGNVFWNGSGVVLYAGSSGNVIQGNHIGTDVSNTAALGNQKHGIVIDDSTGNKVRGNFIAHSGEDGVSLGVHAGNASNNAIGGIGSSDGNTIWDNGGAGVNVINGVGNSILGKSIHDNGGLGIRLEASTSANHLQAAPVLQSIARSTTATTVSGVVPRAAGTYLVQLFANATRDPSGAGEGQTLLGSVSTNANGQFTADLPAMPAGQPFLSATATVQITVDSFGDTSQFSLDGIPLAVTADSSIMWVGNNPPPLTGSVNGTSFTGSTDYAGQGGVVTVTLSTTATAASPVGKGYTITASLSGANADNYVIDPAASTAGTMYVVSLGPDPSGSGAQAVTFWDDKGNAYLVTADDLSSLDLLNLVRQGGGAFDPKNVQQLQSWLSTSPNATTSYQLAVQLAAMDLNVLAGYVQATDLVYAGSLLPYASTSAITGLTDGGFIDVQNLMSAADAILGADPKALAGDPNQAYEAALTQVLQVVNSNTDFVLQEVNWDLFSLYWSLT